MASTPTSRSSSHPRTGRRGAIPSWRPPYGWRWRRCEPSPPRARPTSRPGPPGAGLRCRRARTTSSPGITPNSGGTGRSGRAQAGICTVGGVPADHPVARLIAAAAAGRFPDPDGGWRRVPPWRPGLEAILAFTGHAVFALRPDIPDRLLVSLGADGFGGAHDPRLITALAGADGWIDSLDMLMATPGTGRAGIAPRLIDRPDLATHPRARFAAGIRDHPRLMGYPDPHRSALA